MCSWFLSLAAFRAFGLWFVAVLRCLPIVLASSRFGSVGGAIFLPLLLWFLFLFCFALFAVPSLGSMGLIFFPCFLLSGLLPVFAPVFSLLCFFCTLRLPLFIGCPLESRFAFTSSVLRFCCFSHVFSVAWICVALSILVSFYRSVFFFPLYSGIFFFQVFALRWGLVVFGWCFSLVLLLRGCVLYFVTAFCAFNCP